MYFRCCEYHYYEGNFNHFEQVATGLQTGRSSPQNRIKKANAGWPLAHRTVAVYHRTSGRCRPPIAHKASAGVPKRGIKCQEESQNQCIGISRGERRTKIHAVVDALGNPVHVQLSAGNIHDVTVAQTVLEHISLAGSTVLADKAYGACSLREYIANHDADFCMPPKASEVDPWYCD